MTLEEKKTEIAALLEEMSLEEIINEGFTDLLIEMYWRTQYVEKQPTYISVKGWKTLVDKEMPRSSIYVTRDRINNILPEKSYIEDDNLIIVYDNDKKRIFDIKSMSKMFMMKQGDDNVY